MDLISQIQDYIRALASEYANNLDATLNPPSSDSFSSASAFIEERAQKLFKLIAEGCALFVFRFFSCAFIHVFLFLLPS